MSQKGFAPIMGIIGLVAATTLVVVVGNSFIQSDSKRQLTERRQPVHSSASPRVKPPHASPSPASTPRVNPIAHPSSVPCGEFGNEVIKQKNIEKVHSCVESSHQINHQTVRLVTITYGEGMDCPSGCIYDQLNAVVSSNKLILDEIPMGGDGLLNGIWGKPPLNQIRNNSNFKCPDIRDHRDITLAKEHNRYGWNVRFTAPFTCSWDEYDTAAQKLLTKRLSMSGSIFIYKDGENEKWNTTNLVTNTAPVEHENECPEGQVQYGPPLGCVTKEYMEKCKTEHCPKCLASDVSISTPQGEVNVKNLKVGMKVWSMNEKGNRIISTLLKVSNTDAPISHKIVQLTLADGRKVSVSPNHPTVTGLVGELKVGEVYDRSVITKAIVVPYWDNKTYDLLPDSETGFYWANGVLLGSTLKK